MSVALSQGRLPFVFSTEERDRRYGRTRAMMAEHGFDALLVPCNTGHNDAFQADVRYLTQVGGFANEAALFFPATGAPTCWVRADSQRGDWWLTMQDWVEDVRGSKCRWSEDLATSIREHGLERSTIGLVGLGGTPRSPDGLVLSGTMTRLANDFPSARFESATDAMAQVRMVKSAEEIVALERSAQIAEQSVLAAARVSAPGRTDHEVYAEMVAHMLRSGAELPTMILWGMGAVPRSLSRAPTVREIGDQEVNFSEVEARYAGYIAQVRRPFFVGSPAPDYERLHGIAVESFNLMLQTIRPGASFGEVLQPYLDFVADQGCKPLAVPMHGRGLGEDVPVLRADTRSAAYDNVIEEGQVFVVGPRVGLPDESKYLAWGDTIAVEAGGARRLGTLGQELILAGA